MQIFRNKFWTRIIRKSFRLRVEREKNYLSYSLNVQHPTRGGFHKGLKMDKIHFTLCSYFYTSKKLLKSLAYSVNEDEDTGMNSVYEIDFSG